MAKLSKFSYLLIVIGVLGTASVLLKAYFLASPKTQKPAENYPNRLGQPMVSNKELVGEEVLPNYVMRFPADHGEHRAFDIEWWYLTANLEDQQGKIYGLQWTLFRFRNPTQNAERSNWANNQLYMAHASIHSLDSHWFAQKFARGEVGNVGVELDPFQLYIDNWSWANTANETTAMQELLPAHLSFQIPQIDSQNDRNEEILQVSLSLQEKGPFILQGDKGYSKKSADGAYASYYYSNPFVDISGQFSFGANNPEDTESSTIYVQGQAWFDHEWTSQLVDNQTQGWDWLSLHLDDGSKLMAFRMHVLGQPDYITGTLVHIDGSETLLTNKNLSLIPNQWVEVNKRQLPLSWQVEIPQFNLSIRVKTLKNSQWNPALLPYYEGMVSVSGSHTGKGFLELTGY